MSQCCCLTSGHDGHVCEVTACALTHLAEVPHFLSSLRVELQVASLPPPFLPLQTAVPQQGLEDLLFGCIPNFVPLLVSFNNMCQPRGVEAQRITWTHTVATWSERGVAELRHMPRKQQLTYEAFNQPLSHT